MLTLWYIFFLVCSVQSANILAILPIHLSSHFRIFRPLLERLAEKGHQVDVLSHFPRETPLAGYTDLSVRGSYPFVTNVELDSIKSLTILEVLQYAYDTCGLPLCEAVMKTNTAQKLTKSKKKYDAIIIEILVADCVLGYAHIFKAPLIAVTITVNFPWGSDLIGLPDNPSYIPNYYTTYTDDMTFLERLHNAIILYIAKIWYDVVALEKSNTFIQKTFGRNDVHVREVLRNISILMVNSHFSMQQSRPMTSNFIEIGGIHIKPNRTLSKGIEEHLETDYRGVAFLSFGTYFTSETFPDNYILPLFEALGNVPYKILWKGNKTQVSKHINIPSNIHFIPWLPQVDLLCHPNLTFFITHCGSASLQETIYCGKPILGLPIWVDQFTNANTAVSKGIGVAVPLFEITKYKLTAALEELLQNSKYLTNAKKLSKVFRDRPMSPLDTAVYWTEYVIKHNGAPHLRSKATDLPWFKYHCVDIGIVFILAVLVLFAVVYKLLKIVYRLTTSILFSIKENNLKIKYE